MFAIDKRVNNKLTVSICRLIPIFSVDSPDRESIGDTGTYLFWQSGNGTAGGKKGVREGIGILDFTISYKESWVDCPVEINCVQEEDLWSPQALV